MIDTANPTANSAANSTGNPAAGRAIVMALGATLGAALFVANQTLFRFLGLPDLLGSITPAAAALNDAQAFAAHPGWFLLNALASAAALVGAPLAVREAEAWAGRPRFSPAVAVFLTGCASTVVSSIALAVILGPGSLGGMALEFYRIGTGVSWAAMLAMAAFLIDRGAHVPARDWVLHNASFACIPITLHLQLPVWLWIGFSGDEALATAATVTAAGHLLLTFTIATHRTKPRPV